jgi:hypothetical protein
LQAQDRDEGSDGRYETFVLRLWVEASTAGHGEVHHVQSNASLRFNDMKRALDFIWKVIEAHDGAAAM